MVIILCIVMGWPVSLKKYAQDLGPHAHPPPTCIPVPINVTLLENKMFTDIIKVGISGWDHAGFWVVSKSKIGSLAGKRRDKIWETQRYKQEMMWKQR